MPMDSEKISLKFQLASSMQVKWDNTYDFIIQAAYLVYTDVVGAEDGVCKYFKSGEEKLIFESQGSRSGGIVEELQWAVPTQSRRIFKRGCYWHGRRRS